MKGKYYFAHSKRIYDTDEERELIKQIESLGYNVLCPNKDIGELNAMQPYLDIVKQCEGLIAHEYNGYVGRGAFEEIRTALLCNKPTFVIRDGALHKVAEVKVHDNTDWKIRYGKVLID